MYMPLTGYAGRTVLFNICVTLSGIKGWLRIARQTRAPQAGSTGLNVSFVPEADMTCIKTLLSQI